MPDSPSHGERNRPGEGTLREGTRLQAFLAHAGVASRRACESIILQKRVFINGAVASELGVRVRPGDVVTLDGRSLKPEANKRYILLNKPAGYLSAMSDPEGRPLALELLKGIDERVYNVGRLDQWSSGLLLFTNDGELASLLVHPSGGIEKEYEIVADAPLGEEFFTGFQNGIEIDGVTYRASALERTGPDSARAVLVEGKNREIRRVLERFARRAKILRRVRIGPLTIEGLAEGAFRELSESEVDALRGYGSKSR
ncbi:MAG: pseudouridine synthase [Rectinemataceae bacterium]|jgi:23S rRNA pseudouridine2605 synthase